MTDPEHDEDGPVCDCSDEPKLTDEEWEYVLAVATEEPSLQSGLIAAHNATGEPERVLGRDEV